MRQIKGAEQRLQIAPIEDIEKDILNRMLDPEHGVPFEMRAALRSRLGLPPEPPPAPASTNAPPAAAAASPAPTR
jgi:plasmid stability protein